MLAVFELFEKMNAYLMPMREKFNYYMNNRQVIDQIFKDGAVKAEKIARETLNKIRILIGASNEN